MVRSNCKVLIKYQKLQEFRARKVLALTASPDGHSAYLMQTLGPVVICKRLGGCILFNTLGRDKLSG
jgi:hypothetical protein